MTDTEATDGATDAGDSDGGTPAAEAPTKHRAPKSRRTAAIALIVVGCLLFTAGGLAIWTSNLLLNTDRYVSSVGPLARNSAVQEGVATALANHLVAQVDVEARAKEALPNKAAFLAAPLAQAVRQLVHTAALRLIQTDQFQKAWLVANRTAHDKLEAALTGEGKFGTTKDGKVVVDLAKVEAVLKQRMKASGLSIFDKIPDNKLKAKYELVDLEQLKDAQAMIRLLRTLKIVLPILALVAFVGAVALWPGSWRGLAWVGFGLAITGVVLQLGLIGGRHVLADQAVTPQGARALEAAVNQLGLRFAEGVRLTILIGVLVGTGAMVWDRRHELREAMAEETPPPAAGTAT